MSIAHQDSKQCLLCHLAGYTLHKEILCSFGILHSWMKTNPGPAEIYSQSQSLQRNTSNWYLFPEAANQCVIHLCILIEEIIASPIMQSNGNYFSETMIILDVKKVSTISS